MMQSTALTADLIHGTAELEKTDRGVLPHRLPSWVRHQFPDPQLLAMERQPSGVHLTFTTTASRIELITHPSRVAYRGTDRPRGRVDVVIDGKLHARDELSGGGCLEIDLQTGSSSAHSGPDHATVISALSTDPKRVEMWLPHNESLEIISLRADAPVHTDNPAGKIWLHHGSSISHGSNALAPTEIWPVVAARTAGTMELRNLGFGGHALVDPFLARVIRDAPADFISVKLGINVVNLDSMRLRSFVPAVHGFLDTIRDGHPVTPLLLVSPLFAGIHESTPGPAAVDPSSLGTDHVQFVATGAPDDTAQGRLTLEIIRDVLLTVSRGRKEDVNLYYLDGLELYGHEDAVALPLPDGLHPNVEAHDLIGRRFADRVFGPGRPFATP
jgi:hypothetical protein